MDTERQLNERAEDVLLEGRQADGVEVHDGSGSKGSGSRSGFKLAMRRKSVGNVGSSIYLDRNCVKVLRHDGWEPVELLTTLVAANLGLVRWFGRAEL
eukprot:6465427-Pyramimonas_sp.AAC.2